MYQTIGDRPRHLLPALGGLYAVLEPYSWPLVRAATGLFFVPHGMQKLFGFWDGGLAKYAAGFAKGGFEPGWFWAAYIGSLEFFGGLLLVIGLLTRPVAALFVGFMFVAAFFVTIHRGYFWAGGGLEVPLYLMLVLIAILIRGGGNLSVDRALGREL